VQVLRHTAYNKPVAEPSHLCVLMRAIGMLGPALLTVHVFGLYSPVLTSFW
jgi:hypothetical protein